MTIQICAIIILSCLVLLLAFIALVFIRGTTNAYTDGVYDGYRYGKNPHLPEFAVSIVRDIIGTVANEPSIACVDRDDWTEEQRREHDAYVDHLCSPEKISTSIIPPATSKGWIVRPSMPDGSTHWQFTKNRDEAVSAYKCGLDVLSVNQGFDDPEKSPLAQSLENVERDMEMRHLRTQLSMHHNGMVDISIMLEEGEVDEALQKALSFIECEPDAT